METEPESEKAEATALSELAAAYLDLWEAHGAYSDALLASTRDADTREKSR